VLISPHVLARPHALAFPVMVIWVGALIRAADHGGAPPFRMLPLMTLWANLHGSFTLGIAIVFPIAFEAVWCASPARTPVMRQWLLFALLTLLAGCITPYGPELIGVTFRTIALGQALLVVGEWQPQDFSHLGAFEIILLSGFGYAVYRRIALAPLRLLMVLGLVHLALSQSRHADVLALLAPLLLARALAREFGASPDMPARSGMVRAGLAVAAIAVASAWAGTRQISPAAAITPEAAVAVTNLRDAGPVLNDYNFGAYLDYVGVAPFIDGRAEVYGDAFILRHHRAIMLQDLPDFLRLLDEYKIQATLLAPRTPAVALLDQLPGWQRVYADDIAVVHARNNGEAKGSATSGALRSTLTD